MITSPYIFIDDTFGSELIECSELNILVIIYLYYLDAVEQYMEYINKIPGEIHVEIYSSQQKVLDKAKALCLHDHTNYFLKNNQGRDISTLLVAARESILNADIFCFLHDKKEHAAHLKQDTDIWIKNLWGNLLGTERQVQRIIQLFYENQDLGMLIPPDPIGDYLFHWYSDTWMDNYEEVKQLGKELGLKAEISSNTNPLGLGTAFWARTDAIKKIFVKYWDYKDFPEEPMAVDGALNHAIERIFGYLVVDSGYKLQTVMTYQYASYLISKSQKYMKVMFAQLQKREHIHNFAEVISLDKREKDICSFCGKYQKIYIYGAGDYGRSLYAFVRDRNYDISGFIVSPHRRSCQTVESIQVYEISELDCVDDLGILIGVSNEFREEVETVLRKHNFTHYLYGYSD